MAISKWPGDSRHAALQALSQMLTEHQNFGRSNTLVLAVVLFHTGLHDGPGKRHRTQQLTAAPGEARSGRFGGRPSCAAGSFGDGAQAAAGVERREQSLFAPFVQHSGVRHSEADSVPEADDVFVVALAQHRDFLLEGLLHQSERASQRSDT